MVISFVGGGDGYGRRACFSRIAEVRCTTQEAFLCEAVHRLKKPLGYSGYPENFLRRNAMHHGVGIGIAGLGLGLATFVVEPPAAELPSAV